MNRQNVSRALAPQRKPPVTQGGLLQRKCDCGNHTMGGHECAACSKEKRLHLQTKLKISEPGDAYEQEANRIADQVMATPAHPAVGGAVPRIQRFAEQLTGQMDAVPSSVEQALASPGRPLDPVLRQDMEQRFGHDFSRVRVHTDTRAMESAQALRALAYTVGKDVVFARYQYAPMTCTGRQLLAHELTHVVQQRWAAPTDFAHALAIAGHNETEERQARDVADLAFAPSAARLGFAADAVTRTGVISIQRQPDDLTAYPERERRRIRVSNIPIGLPSDLPDMFTTPRGSTTGHPGASYPVNGTVVYGAGVPSAPLILRLGLASLGGWLADFTKSLPLNSTITLAINLTPYGGTNAHYRFTYFAHTRHRRTSNVMLIELLGTVGATSANTTATAGTFSVRGQNFTLASGWTNTRYTLLRQALELMPDAALREAAGITFYQRGHGTPGEAGHYLSGQDAVEMHDNAFPTSAISFGNVQTAARLIAHELGHVLDLRRMERAWRTFHQAGQTHAAKRTLLHQRSLSGVRWQAPAGAGDYTEVEVAATIRDNEFRKAAQQDGAAVRGNHLSGGVTVYGNTDWEEYFAEAFSIYVTDSRTLEQLRPHVFRYFKRHSPLPTQGSGQSAPSSHAATASQTKP